MCVWFPSPSATTLEQNMLRTQATAGRSYDLVTAVARYFVTLEAHGDENCVTEMLQAVATMIDMMQGPCLENIQAVIAAKVVDACKRILAWSEIEFTVRCPPSLHCPKASCMTRLVVCLGHDCPRERHSLCVYVCCALQNHSIIGKFNGKENRVIGDLNRSVITLLCAMLEGCVLLGDARGHFCFAGYGREALGTCCAHSGMAAG